MRKTFAIAITLLSVIGVSAASAQAPPGGGGGGGPGGLPPGVTVVLLFNDIDSMNGMVTGYGIGAAELNSGWTGDPGGVDFHTTHELVNPCGCSDIETHTVQVAAGTYQLLAALPQPEHVFEPGYYQSFLEFAFRLNGTTDPFQLVMSDDYSETFTN